LTPHPQPHSVANSRPRPLILAPLIHLAARNLLRNRRRTLLTLAGLAVGVGAALILQGFVAGVLVLFGNLMVQGRSGAVQVHKKGHLQAGPNVLDFSMPQDEAFRQKLLHLPGVLAVTARLSFEATLGNGEQSTLALVTAVEPCGPMPLG